MSSRLRRSRVLNGLSWLIMFSLISCSIAPARDDLAKVLLAETEPVVQILQSPSPISNLTVLPAATRTVMVKLPASPTPSVDVCSPLQGYGYSDLQDAISNPYRPPSRPGSDDPHQGVDLAMLHGELALAGDPTYAVLQGVVAAVIEDRFPYGHAMMIETPLDSLPVDWLAEIQIPTPAPTLGPHPSLTCPESTEPSSWDTNRRSLYLLYAHMQDPIVHQVGDVIACGAQVGLIGQSGNALAPHLHLEARVGPGGARFDSLAHYSGGISLEEMRAYCTWRVSGLFQLIDPMRLFVLLP